ncbi:hypothetical protein KBW71_23465 [Hydrogenophaga aromaticivorans]|uniref:hypothetical protein n=1 Tax=Hydrogenophaga aromaticivorans TaxID=2610898 RepID=UPI001B360F62|nr:hypothetical protein [Hydrogenophaga aromaticivorans]MBQ0921406.1 hypothetical protein [Hydrogenophaga aromaticivorans]
MSRINKAKNKAISGKLLQTIQAQIRIPGINRYKGIHKFRTLTEYGNFVASYQTLFPYKNSLLDYFGPAFPKTYSGIFGNKSPKSPTNGHREILWSIARFLPFKEELSKYISLRLGYERSTANGDWASSENILDNIENKYGKSLWLLQNYLSLAHLKDAPKTFSEVADGIIDTLKPYPFIQFTIAFARKRIEGAALKNQLIEELEQTKVDQLVKDYVRAKCLDNTDSRANIVTNLLFFDAQASLIDHYESLVQVLIVASSDRILNDENLGSSLHHPLLRLFNATGDDRLIGPLSTIGQQPQLKDLQNAAKRAKIIESYTKEEIKECIDLASDWLLENPHDSSIRILRAKAQSTTESRPNPDDGYLSSIDRNLIDIFTASENFFVALHEILLISDRFFTLQWSSILKTNILYEAGHEEAKRSQMWQRDAYVRETNISPFTSMLLEPPHDQEFLSKAEIQELFPFTRKVALIAKGLSSNNCLLVSRDLRYGARRDLAEEHYIKAAENYQKAAEEESGLFRIKSLGGASLAYALDGQLELSVEIAVDAYLENPNAPTALPFGELVKKLDHPEAWPNTLKLGILQELHAQNTGDTDLSYQRLAFETYCVSNNISNPNDLIKEIQKLGEKSVIFYLEKVWRPEIMRQTLLYDNDNTIEEARIEVCKVLALINPTNARKYQEELAARIKQQEISKATALVESSRVYVDIEAIKRSLKSKIGKTYAQYKSSASQAQKSSDAILEKLSSILGESNIGSLPTILSQLHVFDQKFTSDPTDLQFNVIFNEITKEFLQGDHGLNAYLSTRVRHGKLVDALRKSVVDEHLVTQRTTSGQYVSNTFWNHAADPEVLGRVLIALEEFSLVFDETLILPRDNLIQIQILDSPLQKVDRAAGLFIYRSSQLERSLLQKYDSGFKDLEELINKCVDSLWEKTDLNLKEVQNELDTTVRSRLINHFDTLSAKLADIFHGHAPASLSSAIARARTATQQALDGVIGWFRRNEVYDRHDYDVDFPPRIAASMVLRTMSLPEVWSGPEVSIIEQFEKLPGRSLDGMVDIYYVLLENAVKHSVQEGLKPVVKVAVRYGNGSFECTVTSAANRPTDSQLAHLQEVRENLASPESRRLAQAEGRSGFRKIWMTLDNTLYRSPELNFEHREDGFFQVRISFRTTSNESSIC